jgi:predicted alpha-1,6-mannanase (GH76 family)
MTALAVAGAITLSSLAGASAANASPPQPQQADMAELMLSYNSSNGLIGNSWWQSGVAVSSLEAYQQATGDTEYNYAITNAFNDNKSGNFENSYMDDTGWWGNAWLTEYQMTGNTQYLQMAETDANYIHQYWDSTCGGGVWWNTSKTYKNAIPNELFLELTAGLHNAISADTTYLSWAKAEWSWFSGSGMINSSNLVNDGLSISSSGACTNNGGTTWTYNQGVILGGLANLYQATGNTSLLTEAEKIANAAILHLSTGGVLVEPCEPSSCGTDGESFKGIFARNLKYLAKVAKTTQYASFFENQARSIEASDTNSSHQLGLQWTGPIDNLTSYSQDSAEDALVASLGLGSSGTVFSGVSSSLCLDDKGSGTTGGNPVQIWGCNSTNAQSWTAGSGHTLRVMGGCATVTGGGTSNGTLIEWEPCTSGNGAQVWVPQSDGALLNSQSGKCLDDPGSSTTAGTQLQLYTCDGTGAQHWTIP